MPLPARDNDIAGRERSPLYNSRRGCLYRGKINIINNIVKKMEKEGEGTAASVAATLPQNVSLAA